MNKLIKIMKAMIRISNRLNYEISELNKKKNEGDEYDEITKLKFFILKRTSSRRTAMIFTTNASEKFFGLIQEYNRKTNKRFNNNVNLIK